MFGSCRFCYLRLLAAAACIAVVNILDAVPVGADQDPGVLADTAELGYVVYKNKDYIPGPDDQNVLVRVVFYPHAVTCVCQVVLDEMNGREPAQKHVTARKCVGFVGGCSRHSACLCANL